MGSFVARGVLAGLSKLGKIAAKKKPKKKKKSKPSMDAALAKAKRDAARNLKETRELKAIARKTKKLIKSTKATLKSSKKPKRNR